MTTSNIYNFLIFKRNLLKLSLTRFYFSASIKTKLVSGVDFPFKKQICMAAAIESCSSEWQLKGVFMKVTQDHRTQQMMGSLVIQHINQHPMIGKQHESKTFKATLTLTNCTSTPHQACQLTYCRLQHTVHDIHVPVIPIDYMWVMICRPICFTFLFKLSN